MSRFNDTDDTRESDDSWNQDTSWAIAPAPRKRRAIDTGQDRNTFRVLRASFRTECMARRAECWLCGNTIDYAARSGTPRSFELDHAIPVSVDPSLALEPSNFRPSHSICNRRRQAGEAEGVAVASMIGEPSEDW